METQHQDDRARKTAAAAPSPQEKGAEGGQAVDPAASTPPPSAEQVARVLAGGLPGYSEGTSALGRKLAREQTIQPAVEALAANRTALWSDTMAAWRAETKQDERFVKSFGGADPIALQKFADLDAETGFEGDVAAARTSFYGAVAGEIQTGEVARERVFPLLQRASAPFRFQGKQIPADQLAAMSRRSHGIGSFYRYSLSAAGASVIDTWARAELAQAANMTPVEMAQAGIAPDDAAKQAALKHLLRTTYAGDAKSLADPGASLARAETWYSPGEISVRPADANVAFADMMTVGALQPEWYADGALDLTIEPAGMREARKPTAFDGMMSALWVARNQPDQTYGVTGGGAREFLEKGVKWAEVKAAVPVIPTDAWLTELARLTAAVPAGSTATEELLRGNDPGVAATQPMFENVIGQSAQEAASPSTVPGQAAPVGAAAMAPGGTFDTARTPAPMHANPLMGGGGAAAAAPAPRPAAPDPAAEASTAAGSTAGRAPPGAETPAPGSAAIRDDVAAAPPAPKGEPTVAPQPKTAANPDISLHAEGSAPAGWQAREVASMPSERIAPDDPGHVYHLLDDGRVIATSQPRFIDARTAQAARAALTPMAMPSPASRVSAAEQTAIEARASDNGGDLKARTETIRGQTVEAQVAVGSSSMAAQPSFEAAAVQFEKALGASAASDGLAAAQAMSAKAKGYITAKLGGVWDRTSATLSSELAKIGADNPGWSGAVGKAVGDIMAVFDGGNVATRMNHVGAFYIDIMAKDALTQKRADVEAWARQAGMDLGVIGQNIDDAKAAQAAGQRGAEWQFAKPASAAVEGQTQTRVHRASTDNTPAGAGDRAATHRTDSSASTAGVTLDPAEARLQGGGDTSFDPAASRLKWEEGARVWIMNETDQWVAWARKLSLPLAAGPSGTTNMLMSANAALGATTPVQARLACMGYLLPPNHHSLVEVMAAAKPFGAKWTPGQDMYKDIEPYSQSALRAFGGGRFPGEADAAGSPAPAPPAPAPAPARTS